LLFDDAAKIDKALHLFKRLAFKLNGGCAGSVHLQYLALAPLGVQSFLFSQFSATVLLRLLLVVLEEV
jgi:hypothetical protein